MVNILEIQQFLDFQKPSQEISIQFAPMLKDPEFLAKWKAPLVLHLSR